MEKNKVLKDDELRDVNGGGVCGENNNTLSMMPKKESTEKYVMGVDPTDIYIVGTCGPTSSEG